MASEPTIETHSLFVERDTEGRFATATSSITAFNHWPIWIFVFFIAPGPLVFDLFERGFDQRMAMWLAVVLTGTAIAGLLDGYQAASRGPTSFASPRTGPTRFTGAICYTTAWGEVVAFAVLNIAGLAYATVTGEWRLKQLYESGYFPLAGTMWILGAFGLLPRVRTSTRGEGHERRYFYGSVWAVALCAACSLVSLEGAARFASG